MLVLTRKLDESISIGDQIKVTILDIKGNQVRLGIKAPRSVLVHRTEIYEKILRENIRASMAPKDLKHLPDNLETISIKKL